MSPTAQPKGGMCLTCAKRAQDCSRLPFAAMPVIERWQGIAIVRCTGHAKT